MRDLIFLMGNVRERSTGGKGVGGGDRGRGDDILLRIMVALLRDTCLPKAYRNHDALLFYQ